MGDQLLFEGPCIQIKHSPQHLEIQEDAEDGYRFAFHMEADYKEQVFWNAGRNSDPPSKPLGRAEWLHTCWRNLPPNEVPFQICLMPSRPVPGAHF